MVLSPTLFKTSEGQTLLGVWIASLLNLVSAWDWASNGTAAWVAGAVSAAYAISRGIAKQSTVGK